MKITEPVRILKGLNGDNLKGELFVWEYWQGSQGVFCRKESRFLRIQWAFWKENLGKMWNKQIRFFNY